MTLLSESYYCVRSVLNFNMDFSANRCRFLQLHGHLVVFSTFSGAIMQQCPKLYVDVC